MNTLRSWAIFALSGLILGGCQPDRDAGAPTTNDASDATGASTPPAREPDASAPAAADVATRYACLADATVDILRNGNARMTLPDGRDFELAHIAGSTPPSFAGNGVYFTSRADGGFLTQEKGATELACTLQEPLSSDAAARNAPAEGAHTQNARAQDAM